MQEFLTKIGLEPHEQAATRFAYAIWKGIDWACPLWKTAGKDVYNRFESRVRTSARKQNLHEYLCKLAHKCHVSVPIIDKKTLVFALEVDEYLALKFAREQSGLLVAAIRAYNNNRKEKDPK
jgi:hypothetical protein